MNLCKIALLGKFSLSSNSNERFELIESYVLRINDGIQFEMLWNFLSSFFESDTFKSRCLHWVSKFGKMLSKAQSHVIHSFIIQSFDVFHLNIEFGSIKHFMFAEICSSLSIPGSNSNICQSNCSQILRNYEF